MGSSLNDILGVKSSPAGSSLQPTTEQKTGMTADVTQQQAENAHLRENGAVPTIKEGGIDNSNTVPSISAPIAPSIEQSVAAKGENKIIPAKATVPTRMSYTDMFTKLSPYQPPTQEELENERKKEKREKVFSAISDGISALSNLYFTTKYAPNMYRHENSQSAKTENKWEKLRANRDAQQNAYIRNLMLAQQADDDRKDKDRAWMRQLGIDLYNQEKDAAEFQYKKDRDATKDDQWKQDHDQKDSQFDQSMEHKEKVLKENERAHKANEGLKGAQIAENGRHNRVSEAQGAARIMQTENHFRATHNADGTTKGSSSASSSSKGTGKQETIRLHDGSVHTYSPDKKGAITALAPSMIKKAKAAAERYRKAGDRKNAQHYSAIADALEKTKNRDGIAAIIVSNVGDFPSMDKDIRSLIGATGTSTAGGFNVNSYRRGAKKPVKKTTSSTNRPPLN